MPSTPSSSVANPHLVSAQRQVLEVTLELIQLDQRLYEIAEGLPISSNYISMEEGLIPYTGVGQMHVTLLQVKGQHLQRAIQALLRLTQQRDDELLTAFVSGN